MSNTFKSDTIRVYTDGSCDTQKRIGAWVSIILFGLEVIMLQGNEYDTTHNRMELLAVINAIRYINNTIPGENNIQIFTDSQYVINLPGRAEKLLANQFTTLKGKDLSNSDLLKILTALFQNRVIHCNKVKAHQKKDAINYNIAADKLSRSLVRSLTKKRLVLCS